MQKIDKKLFKNVKTQVNSDEKFKKLKKIAPTRKNVEKRIKSHLKYKKKILKII